MEPFYFGKSGELFGAYHMAEGMPRGHGLLIAGPLLNEGIRAQFALRQISNRCAAIGYDVMRFDYYGLGNSMGRSEDATLDGWSNDIVLAARELATISGATTMSVITVRFATNLIAELTRLEAVEQVVMWDPVLAGEHWLESLVEGRRNLPEQFQPLLEDSKSEFMGHRMSQQFAAELLARKQQPIHAGGLFAVVSEHFQHLDTLERLTSNVTQVEADCQWNSYESSVLYPINMIDSICQCLS